MPFSKYAHGFDDGLVVQELPIAPIQAGKVFWVSNSTITPPKGVEAPGQDIASHGSWNRPFATLGFALAQTVAGRGDKIYIREGHAETISAAAGIAIANAGVEIYGKGQGVNRPTFTFSTTAATMTMAGNGTVLSNVVLVSSVGSNVNMLVVTGNNVIVDVETQDGSSTHFSLCPLLMTSVASANVRVKHVGNISNVSTTALIKMNGCTTSRVDVDFYGNASVGVVNFITTACVNIEVSGIFQNGTTATTKDVVDTITGSTWILLAEDVNAGGLIQGGSGATPGIFPAVPGVSGIAVSAIKPIPQTTSTTVFTVTGGPILLEYLSYEVTTVVQTQACNFKFTSTDTASSTATDLCANLNITGQAVGTFAYVKMDALATALTAIAGGTGLGPTITNGLVIPVGTVVATTSASNTGNIKYHLRWKALAPTSTVTVA